MTGSGFDDYIWIRSTGQVTVFPNVYSKTSSSDILYKDDPDGSNAWGASSTILETGFDRRALHIGDWDGDGKADIIGVNRETGGVHVWYNNWDGSSFNWNHQDHTSTTNGWCTEGWGLLPGDHGAHFADVTGSGKVDYLCMQPDGTTTAWFRDYSGWENVGQVKFTEDLDRANFRFADINGDGKADLVHTDMFTGNARVWYAYRERSDPENNGGSAMEWERPQTLFSGASRGENTFFPELSGQGRGDMVWIDPTTAYAWISFNTCPAGGDDGDGVPADPGLPVYTPPDTPDQTPEESWFCAIGNGGNAGVWDTQLWLEHGVGTWFAQRTESYYAVDSDWPGRVDESEADWEQTAGVPRVIAKFDGFKQDNAWDWPATCRVVDSTSCVNLGGSDITASPFCEFHEERAFVLWEIRNVEVFLQTFYDRVWAGLYQEGFDNGDLVITFISNDPAGVDIGAAGALTVAAGAFTAIGAIATGGAAIAVNVIAGLLTMGAGMASGSSPPQDVRFDDFSDISSSVGSLGRYIGGELNAFHERLINQTPSDDDFEAGMELARTVQDGGFADQDFITKIDINATNIRNVVIASIISEVWNAQDVAIIKWSDDSWVSTEWGGGYSPCFGKSNGVDIEGHVACYGDKNYAIGRFATPDNYNSLLQNWPDIGSDEDSLARYELTHEQIIVSSERAQARAGSWIPRPGLNGVKDVLEDIKDGDFGLDALSVLKQFNIAVCDLDLIADWEFLGGITDYPCGSDTLAARCFWNLVFRNCHKLELGGGSRFRIGSWLEVAGGLGGLMGWGGGMVE